MSHPALGLPPADPSAAFPAAADRLLAARARVAARALEIAIEADPTMRERHREIGLRELLQDTEAYIDRVSGSIASGDPEYTREWADQVAPMYRRRKVPMDDLVALSEGLRRSSETVIAPFERPPLDAALDAAIGVFRWYRRISGDAGKRNRILRFIYKGA